MMTVVVWCDVVVAVLDLLFCVLDIYVFYRGIFVDVAFNAIHSIG